MHELSLCHHASRWASSIVRAAIARCHGCNCGWDSCGRSFPKPLLCCLGLVCRKHLPDGGRFWYIDTIAGPVALPVCRGGHRQSKSLILLCDGCRSPTVRVREGEEFLVAHGAFRSTATAPLSAAAESGPGERLWADSRRHERRHRHQHEHEHEHDFPAVATVR